MPDDWDFSLKRPTAPPLPIITFGLCALCVTLSFMRWYAPEGTVLARVAPLIAPTAAQIWDGAYFGLVTTFFAHGDFLHLLFNMMLLVQFGREMEATLPPLGYFLFLAAAAFVSMGCEIAVFGHAGVGASGVVYAMFGLMWIGKGRYPSWSGLASRRNLNGLLIWGVICIFTTITGTMLVANVAHFSGLLFGMAVGWLWLAPRRKTIWWAPVILLTITASLSLFWLPWSAEWWYYKASKAFQSKNFRLAVTNYHRSLRLGGNRYYNWENIKRAWVNLAIDAEERKDLPARQEAEKQIESAERLEGPDPDKQPEKQSTPGIHRRTQSQ